MRLQDLLNKLAWEDVAQRFPELYWDQPQNLDRYEQIFSELRDTQAIPSPYQIVLEECTADERSYDAEFYVNVSALCIEDGEIYAIDFIPWDECLGMEISPQALHDYSEIDIAVHCLLELTFWGGSYAQIQERAREIFEDGEWRTLEDGE